MTSQRGKNKKVAHKTKSSGSLMFLPHCDKHMKKYISKDLLNFHGEPTYNSRSCTCGTHIVEHVNLSKRGQK